MEALIRWFVGHRVAANLAMFAILAAGVAILPYLRLELIPNVELDRISIQSQYPGASVSSVEQHLCIPLENAIHDIEGAQELISWSYPGLCSITLDIDGQTDSRTALASIRSRLADPTLLPAEATTPDVQELLVRNRALRIIVSGSVPFADLLASAQTLRSELLSSPYISQADVSDREKAEIRISFSTFNLQKYELNLRDIASNLRHQTGAVAGGYLQTRDGDLLIATPQEFRYRNDFANLALASDPRGDIIRSGDIADITDSRQQAMALAQFDGQPALALDVYRTGNEDITLLSRIVNQHLQQRATQAGVEFTVWDDQAVNFSARVELLLNNAFSGLLLLFIVLLLFLNAHLSFWVSVGILIAFTGTLAVLPATTTSVNFISLFAFILVLGIVVDDAVVVGESIHSQRQRGLDGTQAAIKGTSAVARPVLFSVITTIVAFTPLMFLPGPEGMLIRAVPIVVICTLIFSLFESFFILPAHLKSAPINNASVPVLSALQKRFSDALQRFIQMAYLPFLKAALRQPLAIIVAFLAAFFLCLLLISQGWLKSTLMSTIEGDIITATVMFPQGSSKEATQQALKQMTSAARAAEASNTDEPGRMIRHIYAVVAPDDGPSNQTVYNRSYHRGQVHLQLPPAAEREFSAAQFIQQWRQQLGAVAGAENVTFSASINPAKADIQIEFSGNEQTQLNEAARRLSDYLNRLNGIYSLQRLPDNSAPQLNLQLSEQAINMGLTQDSVLQQVNQAFYGQQVNRFFDQDEEVIVWAGLNEQERASAWYLENLPVEYSAGQTAPLKTLADISLTSVNPFIRHFMRQPVVMVSAYVDATQNNAETIRQQLYHGVLDELVADLPGVRWDVGGYQRAVDYFLQILGQYYLLAIGLMYLLMAILFASYFQPLTVLFAIPFGLLGSVTGHALLGLDLTLWSYVGMVAVSGVVVNDNLVLLDRINQLKACGNDTLTAVIDGCASRFRPVLLTSLTTFAGVLPLISESSVQAKLLIPMATSLGFGVLFATLISLLLVPALCLLADRRRPALHQPSQAEAITQAG